MSVDTLVKMRQDLDLTTNWLAHCATVDPYQNRESIKSVKLILIQAKPLI